MFINLKIITFRIFILVLASVTSVNAHELKLLWELEGLSNPESVVYDEKTNALFVSNVNGSAVDKDGNGFISKISLEGKILELKWLDGLDAPKGLAIHEDKLYAADIDTLVEIDIPSATVSNRYLVSDAKFLNDVAAGKKGNVFVSDMVLNRIHCLHDGKFSIWLESADLQNPNGLLVEKDRLVVGAWGVMTDGFATETAGHLKAVSFSDKSISSIGDGSAVGNLDGVEVDKVGHYFVTDWMAGKLLHIDQAGVSRVLLTLDPGTADLELMQEQKIIFLPMMQTNKLIAYKLD